MRTFQEQNPISAVIPTLDASDGLAASLAALAGSRLLREIVVADGGSRDDTVTVAEAGGARVIAAERARGSQLAAGAAAASG